MAWACLPLSGSTLEQAAEQAHSIVHAFNQQLAVAAFTAQLRTLVKWKELADENRQLQDRGAATTSHHVLEYEMSQVSCPEDWPTWVHQHGPPVHQFWPKWVHPYGPPANLVWPTCRPEQPTCRPEWPTCPPAHAGPRGGLHRSGQR